MSEDTPMSGDGPGDRKARSPRTQWRRRLARNALSLVLTVVGILTVPHRWCAREADAYFEGEPALQDALAAEVLEWVERGLSRANFQTGSAQFDGEWLFGTYMMAGMGVGQIAWARADRRERCLAAMSRCIDNILGEDVRAFDAETWGSDPIADLPGDRDHAAYLGYLNLVLSLNRLLDRASPHAELNDAITTALKRRLENSALLLLQTYPSEVYPVDNCAVIASIALHGRATGADHSALVRAWAERCRRDYVDPKTGLLYQCVHPKTGKPADAPRGSGTVLGLYFLSYADPALSRELFGAMRRELFGTVFGFGGIREYPRGATDGYGDIDSGPILFGYGTSATGFALAGARIHGDRQLFAKLYSTAYAAGAPLDRNGRRTFVTGGPLGNAIMLAMLTVTPAGTVTQYLASGGGMERP